MRNADEEEEEVLEEALEKLRYNGKQDDEVSRVDFVRVGDSIGECRAIRYCARATDTLRPCTVREPHYLH